MSKLKAATMYLDNYFPVSSDVLQNLTLVCLNLAKQ